MKIKLLQDLHCKYIDLKAGMELILPFNYTDKKKHIEVSLEVVKTDNIELWGIDWCISFGERERNGGRGWCLKLNKDFEIVDNSAYKDTTEYNLFNYGTL